MIVVFTIGAANVMERGCKALTLDPTTKGVARIRFRSLKRLNTFSFSNFLQDCRNKGKERLFRILNKQRTANSPPINTAHTNVIPYLIPHNVIHFPKPTSILHSVYHIKAVTIT